MASGSASCRIRLRRGGGREARFALPAPSPGTAFGQKASACSARGRSSRSRSRTAPLAGRGVRIRGRTGMPSSGGSAPFSTISARSFPPTPPPRWRGRSGAARPSPAPDPDRDLPVLSGACGGSRFRSCSPRRPSPCRGPFVFSGNGWGSRRLMPGNSSWIMSSTSRGGLFYVPQGIPDPSDAAFPAAAAEETREILSCSGAARWSVHELPDAVGADGGAAGDAAHTLYVPGDAPRAHLLRAFREGEDRC